MELHLSLENTTNEEQPLNGAASASSLITPYNVAQVLATTRNRYFEELIARVNNAPSSEDGVAILVEEIKGGSEELLILRELYFLVGTVQLTPERWGNISDRKAALSAQRVAAATVQKEEISQ